MIEFKNVSGLSKKFSLKDISFQLEAGYMLGIIGENGAGKTTLLRYMLDENIRYTGEILYDGKNIKKHREEFLEQVGYISEDNSFFQEYTARQNGQLLGTFYQGWDEALFEKTMDEVAVSLGRRIDSLSRGEFMKFQLAFAIAHHAQLYVIDEATAGMDPVFRREIYHKLREVLSENATVMITSHIQGDIEKNMDYICMIEQGNIISYRENLQ